MTIALQLYREGQFYWWKNSLSNTSVISWRSVLLVEETRVHEENHRLTLLHNAVLSTPRHERGSNSQRYW
jgi:hypothetical protein